MRPRMTAVTIVPMLIAIPLSGQKCDSVSPGDEVRIVQRLFPSGQEKVVGRLVSRTDAEVSVLRESDAPVKVIPIAHMAHLAKRCPASRLRIGRQGAVLGSLAGGVVLFLIDVWEDLGPCLGRCSSGIGDYNYVPMLIGGGLLGGVVGGSLKGVSMWRTVPLAPEVTPGSEGSIRLGFSIPVG